MIFFIIKYLDKKYLKYYIDQLIANTVIDPLDISLLYKQTLILCVQFIILQAF